MKYEEYEQALRNLASNPDTMVAGLDAFLENLKNDLTVRDTLEAENVKLSDRIRDLQDTNMKLWISKGGKPDDPEPEELPEGDAVIDEILKELEVPEGNPGTSTNNH